MFRGSEVNSLHCLSGKAIDTTRPRKHRKRNPNSTRFSFYCRNAAFSSISKIIDYIGAHRKRVSKIEKRITGSEKTKYRILLQKICKFFLEN